MTMTKTVFHFTGGVDHRQKFIDHAKTKGLTSNIPHGESNSHSIEIEIPEDKTLLKSYNETIDKYSLDTTVAVFSDKQGLNMFKPHRKINSHNIPLNIKSIVNYGRTASFMGQYYKYPVQNGTPPTIAIISLGGTYLSRDLSYYWTQIEKLPKYPTVTYVNVDRTTNAPNQVIHPDDGSEENTLDIEISGSLCPGSKIVVYFGPNSLQGFYDTISAAIHDSVHKPSIISISWGAPESDFGSTDMIAYDQLLSIGNQRGISITVASGDNGSNDGVSDGYPHCDFPSSSPHAISCGGTSLGVTSETTWSWNPTYSWGTGGGISAQFLKPLFQTGILNYPTNTLPSISLLIGNRGIPDVSLNADPLTGWTIYFNGQVYINSFGGTSCVAPAVAGLLGLMNLKYPTNFCTTLYSVYSDKIAFKDIVSGTNDNIPGSVNIYNAGVNYDLCTGLGAINGTGLLLALKTSNV